MKRILLSVLMVGALHARADWVEESVIYDVNSKDAMEMAEALGHFPSALDWLNAHNLTGTSRLKVVGVAGRVAWYRWENDASCTVTDPGKIDPVRMYNVVSDYLYEAQPTKVWQLTTTAWSADPCVGPRPQTKHSARKK